MLSWGFWPFWCGSGAAAGDRRGISLRGRGLARNGAGPRFLVFGQPLGLASAQEDRSSVGAGYKRNDAKMRETQKIKKLCAIALSVGGGRVRITTSIVGVAACREILRMCRIDVAGQRTGAALQHRMAVLSGPHPSPTPSLSHPWEREGARRSSSGAVPALPHVVRPSPRKRRHRGPLSHEIWEEGWG